MRRGHEARLVRLMAPHEAAERDASDERRMLRCYAALYPLIREAMLRAGLDPADSWAMREIAEKLAGFVDTPELQRADAEAAAAESEGNEPVLIDGMDPREALIARLDEVSRQYRESGRPLNLWFASFWELLAWATPPDDAEECLTRDAGEGEPATEAEEPLSALRGEREGPRAKRWEGEVGLPASALASPTSPRPSPPPKGGEGVNGDAGEGL